MNDETVTISKKEYEQLLKDHLWLQCLESAGVDNWDGWSYACEILQQHEDDGDSI